MEKFLFVQYYDLNSDDFKVLNDLLIEFYNQTGILSIAIPKQIELMTREEVHELGERLKKL